MLQPSVLLDEPTQSAPPPCGAGFVQVRVLVCEPAPQVRVQVLQDDHWLQPPFTVTRWNINSSCIRNFQQHSPLVPVAGVLQLAPVNPWLHEHWFRSLQTCMCEMCLSHVATLRQWCNKNAFCVTCTLTKLSYPVTRALLWVSTWTSWELYWYTLTISTHLSKEHQNSQQSSHGVDYIVLYNVKQEIPTLLVPHFAPSGTRPAIMSDPGTVVKDLGKIYRTLAFEGIHFVQHIYLLLHIYIRACHSSAINTNSLWWYCNARTNIQPVVIKISIPTLQLTTIHISKCYCIG